MYPTSVCLLKISSALRSVYSLLFKNNNLHMSLNFYSLIKTLIFILKNKKKVINDTYGSKNNNEMGCVHKDDPIHSVKRISCTIAH